MNGSFDLASARTAAAGGQIGQWVQDYLRTGPWANLGLADGLLLCPRWWVGPFEAPLAGLARKCGPEADLEYVEPLARWNQRTDAMAATIQSVEQLPPLIAEWRPTGWVLADGSHRHEALLRRGFVSCWAVGWFNSEKDFHRHRS